NKHRSLFSVECELLIFVTIVLVTAQNHLELRVVVDRPLQIAKVALLVMVDSTRRERASRRRTHSCYVVNTGNQVHKQIAWQTRSIVFVASPRNKAPAIERPFRRVPEPSIPVNCLFIRIWGDRKHPCAAVAVAVPDRLNRVYLSQPPGIPDLLRLGVHDRTHALASNLA